MKRKKKVIWRLVPGFEDRYKINNFGVLVSTKTNIRKKTRNKDGYEKVWLWNINKPLHTYIHRLVLMTFVGVNNNAVVDHINGIRNDNRLEN